MTVEEFVAFLISRIGLPWEQNDYDGQYQSQCVDYFNIGYQYKEGISPYSRGYGVNSAYQLYLVADTAMVSIPNSDDLQILAGDALIYNQSWGNGDGHVEWALTDSNQSGCDIAGANIDGSPTKPVSRKHRTWVTMNNGLIGVRRFVTFKEGGNVLTDKDVDVMRIIETEIKGFDYEYVHSGKFDKELISAHAGKDCRTLVREQFHNQVAQDYRNGKQQLLERIEQLEVENTELKKNSCTTDERSYLDLLKKVSK